MDARLSWHEWHANHAKQKKNKGCIVNMSSSAARFANPLLAQYSGTKGYIENLTASLATAAEAEAAAAAPLTLGSAPSPAPRRERLPLIPWRVS